MKTYIKAIICFAAFFGLASAQEHTCDGQAENSAHPSYISCAHYFQCVGGVAELDVCPEPLLFNPDSGICDHAENVECEEVTFPPPIAIECYPDGIEFHPHPYSCNKFIMCVGGLQIEQECAPNLHWSGYEGWCTTMDQAECTIENDLCPEIDDPLRPVFIPSSRDCAVYYLCFNRETHTMRCAPGKWFDPENEWCDVPENVNCEVGITPTPEPIPPIEEGECGEDGFYYLPHPQSCEYYFLCTNGESSLQRCAPGFHFDIIIRKCRPANDAVCLQMPTDEPEGTDEPTGAPTDEPPFTSMFFH